MSSIFISPLIQDSVANQIIPEHWLHRSLYATKESAEQWITSEQEYYQDETNKMALLQDVLEIIKALNFAKFEMFISFGPGDGLKDTLIIQSLPDKRFKYVPVDVSNLFITNIMQTLADIIEIPFGIQADIEDEISFIYTKTRQYKHRLISFLGNTFGNLDNYELTFVKSFIRNSNSNDLLLIEIGTFRTGSNFKDRLISYINESQFKNFVAQNIHIRSRESLQDIFGTFEKRIGLETGLSNIPNAQVYNLHDSNTTTDVLRLIRYEWLSFLLWFEQFTDHLEVVYEKEILYNDYDLGTGIILLRKK